MRKVRILNWDIVVLITTDALAWLFQKPEVTAIEHTAAQAEQKNKEARLRKFFYSIEPPQVQRFTDQELRFNVGSVFNVSVGSQPDMSDLKIKKDYIPNFKS